MVAMLKREVDQLLTRLGLRRAPSFKPAPDRQTEIDYDKLYENVSKRYPRIMKRLGE